MSDRTLNLDNFSALFRKLTSIDLSVDGPPAPPWGSEKPTAEAVSRAVKGAQDALPVSYQKAYVAPLLDHAQRVASTGTAETVAGAVYCRDAGHNVLPELQRFQVMTSFFYRFFVWEALREKLNIPLIERLPPLSTFASGYGAGPFTLPADTMQEITGSRVGVVSMPSSWRTHPIFWLPFGHETGGHDVVHADTGMLEDLQEGVIQLFGGDSSQPPPSSLSFDDFVGRLWAYWMDEVVADVCALMELGPAFGMNLSFVLALMVNPKSPTPTLRTASFGGRSKRLDVHPTDLLRVSVAIGATETLAGLSESSRKGYIGFLEEIGKLCAGSAKEIQIQGVITAGRSGYIQVNQAFPLARMQQAARRVGRYVASVKLPVLDGKSLSEIEGWNDAADQAAGKVRDALCAGSPIAGLGNVAQLLSGTTLALIAQPDSYEKSNAALAAGLDAEAANDAHCAPPDSDPFISRNEANPDFSRENFSVPVAADGG